MKGCATCSTELTLLRQFLKGEPSAEELGEVEWISQRLVGSSIPEPVPAPAAGSWLAGLLEPLRSGGWAWAGAAALLAMFAFSLRDAPPGLPRNLGQGPPIVRSGQLQALAPVGEIEAAPRELIVETLPAAAGYRFELREVDRTAVWTAESKGAQIELPDEIAALALPGKTLAWTAAALDASGAVLAESPPARFSVRAEDAP